MKMAADMISPRIRNSEFQSHWWLYSGRGTIYKWEMIKRHTQKLEIHEKHFKIIILKLIQIRINFKIIILIRFACICTELLLTIKHGYDIIGHMPRENSIWTKASELIKYRGTLFIPVPTSRKVLLIQPWNVTQLIGT